MEEKNKNKIRTVLITGQQAEYSQFRFKETTPVAVHKSSKSLVQWSDNGDLFNRFTHLSCKKSYFWGEENGQMPILKKLDGIKKYMIHRSGHSMMIDNPIEFYTTLVEFIDQFKTF